MKQARPQAFPGAPPQLPPPGALESFFIFISLMLVTQALGPLLMAGSSGDDALGDSNPATLLSALLVYTIAFFLLGPKDDELLTTTDQHAVAVAVASTKPAPPASPSTATTTDTTTAPSAP